MYYKVFRDVNLYKRSFVSLPAAVGQDQDSCSRQLQNSEAYLRKQVQEQVPRVKNSGAFILGSEKLYNDYQHRSAAYDQLNMRCILLYSVF